MCGLKEMSLSTVDRFSYKGVIVPQPESWFSRLASTAKAWWRSLAGLSSSSPSSPSDPSISPESPILSTSAIATPMLATECAVKEALDEAIAEEQSVMAALRAVGLSLSKAGFEPGRDFSIAQGRLLLNAHAYSYVQQAMDPQNFADIIELAPDLLHCDNHIAMAALNQHLGVDFFENLRETMLVRLPSLSDTAMLGYASRLIQGISHRHPEIKGFEHWVKQIVHEAIDPEHLRTLERQCSAHQLSIQEDEGWVLLLDLIMAAGGQEDLHFQRTVDGVVTTDAGKALLSQLIAGPSARIHDLA